MSYDAANELLNVNAATYTYDLNGNRTQKIDGSTSTAYTYDDENRLVRVEITSGTTTVITYAYDPFGRRIEKNVNGTITRYLYDKQAVILEYNQAGTVQTRYTHGPGIDEPLAMEKDSLMYYYHADGLGSIIALTNTSGGVAQRYNYDAFGNITSGAPTVAQPYTYTAREYDPETGLYFYRARYYDPRAGRFLSRDPIAFAGGDVNLYLYVRSNPVNKIDPTGLYETLFGYTECFAEINWVALGISVADFITGVGLELTAITFPLGVGTFAPEAVPFVLPAAIGFGAGGYLLTKEAKHSYSEAFEEYIECVQRKKKGCPKNK